MPPRARRPVRTFELLLRTERPNWERLAGMWPQPRASRPQACHQLATSPPSKPASAALETRTTRQHEEDPRPQHRDYIVHERSSRSAPSRLHQFCTSRQQLSPTTWHAGGQLSCRPLRWLAEDQSRLLNRPLCASAIGLDHLLASGTKDQAVGPLSRARRGTRSTIAFSRLDFAKKRDYPHRIFKSRITRVPLSPA